jgi:hypothetical protein
MCSAMRHISPAPPGSRLSWCPSIHRAMGDPECTLSSRICALAGCSAPGQACRCCQAFHDINRIPNRATFGLGVVRSAERRLRPCLTSGDETRELSATDSGLCNSGISMAAGCHAGVSSSFLFDSVIVRRQASLEQKVKCHHTLLFWIV